MPEAITREYKNDHYVEELEDYGEKLSTQKGVCDIVYRNSSNGYYGGYINKLDEAPDTSSFKQITDDWTAQ